jgi:Nuclease-related domain
MKTIKKGGFFIKKQHIYIQKLEALLRRIPTAQPQRHKIEEQLSIFKAGIRGEQSLEYFYRYLPKNEVMFAFNIRILHMDYYFQMDTLLLTSKFLLLLEIKNYTGHLYFDDKFGQLVRTVGDKVDYFDDPLEQVKRQKYHLSQILEKKKFTNILIEHLVVFSNKNSYIECSPTYKEAFQRVIKSHKLQSKYEEFKLKHKYSSVPIEPKRIIKLLNKLNEPYNPDISNKFKITERDLITGVLCASCENKSIMTHKNANWNCVKCCTMSKDAHIQALKDYAILISPIITNKKCKEFLHLSNRRQSLYLLQSLNLPFSGSNRNYIYHLDSLIT